MLLFWQSQTFRKRQVSLRGRPPSETALPLGCWFWLRRLFHDRFRCPYAQNPLLQDLLTSLHPHISFTNTSNNLALQQGFSIHSREVRLHPSLPHSNRKPPGPDVHFEVHDLLHQCLWWIKPSPRERVDLVFRFVQLRSQCLHCAARGSRTTILVLRPLVLRAGELFACPPRSPPSRSGCCILF